MIDKILAVYDAFMFGWEAGGWMNDVFVQDAIDTAFDDPGSGEIGPHVQLHRRWSVPQQRG